MQNENQNKSERSLREEAVLEFWQQENIFEKSLEKESPKGNYVFYDGPPFATGLPHYGHILGSTAKDVIGRYKTMEGFHVPRKWGWDCHGLPIENIVEKELGISGRRAIEEYGVEKFSEYARSKVLTYVHDWKKTVDRIGRFVDFDGGYKTMDNSFIESVWWALGELNNKGLLYEGVRVLAYCPRCETPIANSEIAMDNSYKDITDISVYAKFELVENPGTFFVAWTTTPWTLPGNVALAINPEYTYSVIEIDSFKYIIAKERLLVVRSEYKVIEEVQGVALLGKKYKPVFDYYINDDSIKTDNLWSVVGADFVTLDAGTGIVHIAPAFGENDMDLAKKESLPWIIHVDQTGKFKPEVSHFAGNFVKPKDNHQAADIEIVKYLAHNHLLFEKEKIIHSYPHCYRCDTPLYYYALPSWFVNVQKIKPDFIKNAKTMNWIPEHLKEGRFSHTMENAPDWTISRNRFWASPLPIWKNSKDEIIFVDSIETLKKYTKKSGNTYFLMRHGQSQGNITERVSSVVTDNDPLTEEGISQVENSIKNIAQAPDVIIASPFMRTKQTAEMVGKHFDVPVIFDERLGELNAGEFEGKNWNDYHNYLYGHDSGKWFDHKIPGGESLRDVSIRMGQALYEIEQKYQNKKVLIVTHGGPAWLAYVVSGQFMPDGKEYKVADSHVFVSDFKRFANAEVREFDFVPLPHNAQYEIDLHRPYIDNVMLVDDSGTEYRRIPEVIDCWFESGSMPFAQDHYPFERSNWKQENFPAGFVAEYIAQTRTWFYYTHVLSSTLFDTAPFQNVVTTGTLLAADGQKMSKSKGNYPDPWILFDKFGVDPLRMYLMSSTLMKGEDTNFSEKLVQDIATKIFGRLSNVLSFYELYRNESMETNNRPQSKNVLDLWIVSRLEQVINEVTNSMSAYELDKATRPFDLFVDDLSTWYLRRSRDRLKDGDADAKQTLYYVLKTVAQVMAPFAPFTAEDLWQKLKTNNDEVSVHLTNWPLASEVDEKIITEMELVRTICTEGNALRKKLNIPVRQPLASFTVTSEVEGEYKEIICDELNVKQVLVGTEYSLDTNITDGLKREGNYRELVRALQDTRKAMGLTPDDVITLTISENAQGLVNEFMDDLKKTVQIREINFADGENEIVVADETYKITIQK